VTPEIVGISLAQLAFGLVFILGAGIASIMHALKLERDLLPAVVQHNSVGSMAGGIDHLKFMRADGDNLTILQCSGDSEKISLLIAASIIGVDKFS